MDDFIAIGLTLEQAKAFKARCESFLATQLSLELSHWHIQPIRKGINFVGYRTWQRIKFIRKHSMFKFRRYAKRGKISSLASLIGHAKVTGSAGYLRSILDDHNLTDAIPTRSMKWLSI